MIIRDIAKVGMIVGLIGTVVVAVIFHRFDYVIAYVLGYLASNLNLLLNDKLLDISGTKNGHFKNFTGYLIRMLVYATVLVLMLKVFNINAMLVAFVGCLTIRVSILIYGIKGGIVDGHFK